MIAGEEEEAKAAAVKKAKEVEDNGRGSDGSTFIPRSANACGSSQSS